MSKNIIYCYSGGGNCLDMAKNIAKELGDTDIIMMRSFPAVTDASEADRVGFIFPCYGGGLPGGVEESVKAIKIKPGTYTFGIAQCAGYMGSGLHKINKIHHLDYWAKSSHQSACIWLMPHTLMVPIMSAAAAQRRSEKNAKRFAADIRSRRQSKKEPPRRLLNAIESKGFPLIAKKKAASYTVDAGKCVGCGTCADVCPKDNISMASGSPSFGKNCIGCLACIQYCPKHAIDVGKVTRKRERYTNPNISAREISEQVIHIV